MKTATRVKRRAPSRQNCQDFPWTVPTGPARTQWRLTWWLRIRPGLELAHLPTEIAAALAVLDTYNASK